MRMLIGRMETIERDFAEVSCIARTEIADKTPGNFDVPLNADVKKVTINSELVPEEVY